MRRENTLRKSIIEWIIAIALVAGGIMLWNAGSAKAMGGNMSPDGSQTTDLCSGS